MFPPSRRPSALLYAVRPRPVVAWTRRQCSALRAFSDKELGNGQGWSVDSLRHLNQIHGDRVRARPGRHHLGSPCQRGDTTTHVVTATAARRPAPRRPPGLERDGVLRLVWEDLQGFAIAPGRGKVERHVPPARQPAGPSLLVPTSSCRAERFRARRAPVARRPRENPLHVGVHRPPASGARGDWRLLAFRTLPL